MESVVSETEGRRQRMRVIELIEEEEVTKLTERVQYFSHHFY